MQSTPSAPLEPASAEGKTQAATYGSCETLEIDEELDWEGNGSLLNLCIDIASGCWSQVLLLCTLVASLEACRDSFLKCNQEDTPQLRNYGEVLLCHYTKAFVFSFPAMATAVLVLLFGRDFLQKRFYYGLLKAGGVISFIDNTPWKDTLFKAMCLDFCHCVGYTCLHIIILKRAGAETVAAGLVPQGSASTVPTDGATTTAVTALTTTLGVKAANVMFQKFFETVMILITTFFETLLLLIFFYFAYDITGALVPMSEYLDSYEDQEENPMDRLHSFRDSAAQSIVEQSPQLISGVDGDLHKAYERIVEKYLKNKDSIGPPGKREPDSSQVEMPNPEEPTEVTEPDKMNLANLKSISLWRSLWPAELLMHRDIEGSENHLFQRVWVIYSILAIFWLVHISFVLNVEETRRVWRLMESEIEEVIPLTILLCHVAAVIITIYAFCKSLAPLGLMEA